MPPTKKATTKRAGTTSTAANRTAKKAAGSAEKASGATKRNAAGAAKKASSATKRASAPAKKATGSAKKAAGTAKKAAGTAKKATAPVRKAAAAATRATGTSARSGGNSSTAKRRRSELDALELLIDDHREVEELFTRFERSGPGAQKRRQQLVTRMVESLSMHAAIEEQVFYPMARQEVPDTNDDVLEALEEHHLVKLTLNELEGLDPNHERFAAKVSVLMENVRHHVEEEENELFPEIRRALGDERLREIGRELAAAKQTAPTRPHPAAPDTPPGNIVAQAITAPFDVAANVTEATARRVRDLIT
jgi:hemerythrin-like domain-containing protein